MIPRWLRPLISFEPVLRSRRVAKLQLRVTFELSFSYSSSLSNASHHYGCWGLNAALTESATGLSDYHHQPRHAHVRCYRVGIRCDTSDAIAV